MDVYHILYMQPIRASMNSPGSSHTAGPLSLAGGHALGAHWNLLKLKPSRQRYAKHNDRCPAIGCTRPYPRDGIGVSPKCMSTQYAWGPTSPTVIINEHNPRSRFHAYMSFSFSFLYISYIFLTGLCFMQFTVFHVIQFMFKYSYKQAIIVQGPHVVTCITHHIRLKA